VATTAIDTVPISQTAMQNMAQDRAVRISKLSPSNETLRRQVEALGQFLFDRWPIALYRPIVVGKSLQNLDSDAWTIIRFEKRLEEWFAHILADLGNRIDGGDADIVIVIGQEPAQDRGNLGRYMTAHSANQIGLVFRWREF